MNQCGNNATQKSMIVAELPRPFTVCSYIHGLEDIKHNNIFGTYFAPRVCCR